MKCHYEVLGVPTDVNDEELKKSYRKLALKWHPDKNLTNQDLAKEQFQLIQQAYDILSDPQERSWYDRHRDAILKGGLGDNYQDNSLDVFQYFTTTCFKGYTDDEQGFYTVYREVFNKLTTEDLEFADDPEMNIPGFGTSDSDYETVVHPFYAYWSSYSTKKTYSWLDPYDIRDTPNRRVLRLVEKENKKVRDKAKKQRNEEVRNLVAFVRKRDRRVHAWSKLLEEKAAENTRRAEERRRKALLDKQEKLKNYKEEEWSKFSNIECELKVIEASLAKEFNDHVDSDEDSGDDSDEEKATEVVVDDNMFYCQACNKVFKTDKSFSNHEKSKKHKENVELLKQSLLAEECEEISEEEDIEEEEPLDGESDEEVSDSSLQDEVDLEELVPDPGSDMSSDDTVRKSNKTKKQLKKEKSKKRQLVLNGSVEEAAPLATSPNDDTSEPRVEASIPVDEASVPEEETAAPKKQKGKKAKEARKRAATDRPGDSSTVETTQEHRCVTCKTLFQSKNKLFDHLKTTGHSVYIPGQEQSAVKSASAAENQCVTCKSLFQSKNKLFDHLKATGHSVYIPGQEQADVKANKRKARKNKS